LNRIRHYDRGQIAVRNLFKKVNITPEFDKFRYNALSSCTHYYEIDDAIQPLSRVRFTLFSEPFPFFRSLDGYSMLNEQTGRVDQLQNPIPE